MRGPHHLHPRNRLAKSNVVLLGMPFHNHGENFSGTNNRKTAPQNSLLMIDIWGNRRPQGVKS